VVDEREVTVTLCARLQEQLSPRQIFRYALAECARSGQSASPTQGDGFLPVASDLGLGR